MWFVDASADRNMPNIAKTEDEEAKQKGEECGGMHALQVPVCISLIFKN